MRSITQPIIEIRTGTLADAVMIARVHIESKRAAYQGILPEAVLMGISVDECAEKWQGVLQDEGFAAFLADVQGVNVGVVLIGPSHDLDCDPLTTEEVHALYVSPRHWGQGIGRMLVHTALARSKARGFKELRLWTVLPAAGGFYERLGFVRDGVEKVGPLMIPGSDLQVTDVRYRMSIE